MIRSSELDPHFAHEVMSEPGGEHLMDCWSCGTCAATCLVRRFDAKFNPRLILRQAGMGMREAVLSSNEIWLCSACDACYPRCPKQIHISEVMRAIRAIAIREGRQPQAPRALVDQRLCSSCAVCTRACPYEAIDRVAVQMDGQERVVARVDPQRCMACGVCVAVCPSGALSLEAVNDAEIGARMAAGGWLERPGFLSGGAERPRMLAFVCQWSMRTDAEWDRLAALGEHVRVVNLPCSGRVDPELILSALTQGADGVLVVGCKEGECHYQRGTYLGRSKVALLEQLMTQMGLPQTRVRFVEIGALDRFVLAGLLESMSDEIRASVAVRA